MTIQEKIISLQSQLGVSYKKPSIDKLKLFQKNLSESDVAKKYLQVERNLTDETIKYFGLGYDIERNAIAIPIFKRGELINIKYRLLEPNGKPKYIQEKDCEVWLYHEDGIQYGMKKGGVLITEGEFDLMSCFQAGFKNVISPASGKDSYGIWLELIDNIPRVFIAYDNDKPGKETAIKLADRIDVEKCLEVIYPEGFKDANDYFKTHNSEDYKELLKVARPFYHHQFKGMVDIIEELRNGKDDTIKLNYLPDVKLGKDWLVIISGISNVGKSSYVMNLAEDLTSQNIPVLVLPFERGCTVIGTRFLQVKYSLGEGDMIGISSETWDKMKNDTLHLPLYFSLPTKDETMEVIKKSKRIFNTRVVIVDHLDYMVRNSQHKEQEIGQTLQALKRLAEEQGILMIIVTHIRKIDGAGATQRRKPGIEDLKGSASLYQDPECVVMLTSPEEGLMNVNVAKNKGKMSQKDYGFNRDTGRLSPSYMAIKGVVTSKDNDDKHDEWGGF